MPNHPHLHLYNDYNLIVFPSQKPPWALAQAVLAEVPNQVSEYFLMKKLTPGARPPQT